jgi:hypothetical protein
METIPLNQLSPKRSSVRLETHSGKVGDIDALCVNCNKHFKSTRAVSMHLRITGARHLVNITNHGYYDKKTGLRVMNRRVINQSSYATSDAASVQAAYATFETGFREKAVFSHFVAKDSVGNV